jgi:hypothetical protein
MHTLANGPTSALKVAHTCDYFLCWDSFENWPGTVPGFVDLDKWRSLLGDANLSVVLWIKIGRFAVCDNLT